ncbi:MAG: MAPEG family protein [Pseudomonadota bacterium]|nr:MAPEG family protein [Pseudomonadota bacterium]
MHSAILQPVIVLIGWTLVMLIWMLATRLPAMGASGIDLGTLRGTKPADADQGLPPEIQWKAHNYNHLHEQPVLFYAVCLVIAFTGTGDGVNAWIAWVYVALRIAHSLWQATINKVSVRFALFLLASVALAALTVRATMAVF